MTTYTQSKSRTFFPRLTLNYIYILNIRSVNNSRSATTKKLAAAVAGASSSSRKRKGGDDAGEDSSGSLDTKRRLDLSYSSSAASSPAAKSR